MLPLILIPDAAKIGLIGAGEALERRRSLLAGAGVPVIELPPEAPFDGLKVLFVAGLERAAAREIAERARRAGILVNVEDVPDLCDFHVPAIVRRGDLLFSVSTRGRAPALARRLREWLEERFGPEWESHSEELGDLRDTLRRDGIAAGEIADRTRSIISEKGWLA